MHSQVPQDNMPPEVWVPLAIILWSGVFVIYVVLPWIGSRKKRKKK